MRGLRSSIRSSSPLTIAILLMALAGGSVGHTAEIGTVTGATTDGSGTLIDITYDVDGNAETLPAAELIPSTLVLSTLQARAGAPGAGDANRFWTLDGAPEPTEGQALRSLGDKSMATALQDCSSTSQHDVIFDTPILPGPGPEIFLFHGGLNDPFVILDKDGAPALTIPNALGDAISVAVSTQFRAWYLRDNVNYEVFGTFPHTDTQDRIVALDLDSLDVAAIGGLRFAGGACDYVYEILGRQPAVDPLVPFARPQIAAETSGRAVAADLDGDGDLDTLITPGLGAATTEMAWLENDGGPAYAWTVREIAASEAREWAAAADLDGDGDVDVVAASETDVAWFENDGAVPPGWTERSVTTGETLLDSLEVADLRGDGDIDLLVASDGEILWFENNGAAPPAWYRQAAVSGSDYADAEAADLDRDGDLDLVVAGGAGSGFVRTVRNDGGGAVTVGEPLTNRTQDDLAAGYVFVSLNTPFGADGRLSRWAFYDDDTPGRRITPLIFRENAGSPGTYAVVGIGTTRQSDGSGVQIFDFDPIAGSNDLVLAGDLYGWKDGLPDHSIINAGVADLDFASATAPAYWVWGFGGTNAPPVSQGVTLDNVAYQFRSLGRDYSIEFTVEPWIWTPLTALSTPNPVRSLAVGDVDGDGDLDAAAATPDAGGFGSATLLRLDNDGSGLWSSTDAASPAGPQTVELLDLNLDGDIDLLFGTDDAGAGEVAWLSNDTALGDFGEARTIVSGFTTALDVGDLDGDGDVDVLASADVAAWVENRTIHRSGLFPTERVITGDAESAVSVFAIDVDGDGDIDALSASQLDDTIAWYDNDGASPPSWTKRIIASDTDSAFNVSAGDVDGDGDIDVLSASQPEDLVAWYENDGASPPSWTKRIVSNTVVGAISVVPADIDGDGDLDALTAANVGNTIAWYANPGTIDIVNPDFELLYKAGSTTVTSPVFGDPRYAFGSSPLGMTGDATVTFSDGSTGGVFDMPGWQWSSPVGVTNVNSRFLAGERRDMVLYMNGASYGGGTAGASVTQTLSESLEQNTLYTLTADFGWRTDNGAPTLPPLLNLYAGGTLLTPTTSSSPALVQGRWVTHSRTYQVSNPGISGPLEIEIGLGPNTNGQQLNIDRVRLGKSWTENVISTTAILARNAIAADVDGDGDLDVLSATAGDDTVAWYENPSWTRRVITDAVGGPRGVFAADVDGDGDVDALSASIDDDTIAWYENDGNVPPSWTERVITDTADRAYSVVAADLDADGDIDALSASLNDDTVAWYENDGNVPPSWTKHVITATALGARAVFVADLDGDGDPDALSASENDDTIGWYENEGGQFGNQATACFAGTLVEGEEVPLVATTVELNARPLDSAGLLVRFDAGLGLEPSQLSSVLDTLRVWRDDGSGEFEADSDLLLATYRVAAFPPNGGTYTIPLPASEPGSIVAGPATYLVTGVVRADAAASGFPSLTASNVSGSPVLHDATANAIARQVIPLSQETSSAVPCAEVLAIERVIVIDDTADAGDATPGDGACATAGGACTLRAAISEANATPGPDRISIPAGTYTLTMSGSDNTNAAGDLDINDDLTLVGAGADSTIIDASGIAPPFRPIDISAGVTVSIHDLTLTGGNATVDPGGGLEVESGATVELQRCVVTGNRSSVRGGGINAKAGSFLQLVDSRVVGNDTDGEGGGIYSTGTVSLVWSEISGNTSGGGGGGLFVDSVLQALGSTISGNSAVGSFGGGIFAGGGAFVALDNSTVVGNDSAGAGGGVMVDGGATLNSSSTILAGNLAGGASDCTGALLSGGYTLLGSTSGCSVTSLGPPGTDLLNVDPLLAPLGDNGGTSLTHRPLLGSPVIDAGNCGGAGSERDQTGEPRPIDNSFIANAADGCDIGAYEARLGQSLPTIEVPIRWCGLRGAPSIDDPSLVGLQTHNDVLRRRHEIVTDEIYSPKSGIVFRSGGNFIVEEYPILEDPDCTETSPGVFDCVAGVQGDVVLDRETSDFSEFENLITACRERWQALDPDIQGITAVTINTFIDPEGNELNVRGAGGRAPLGDVVEQINAARVMLIDPFYRGDFPGNPNPPNPVDEIERLLGHEMGHALSLDHGNGLDDDDDNLLDNNDENAVGLPRFDGPNLLQYRNGTQLSVAQAEQMRLHIQLTMPDDKLVPFSDSIADLSTLGEEQKKILGFGYDAVAELEQKKLLGFEQKSRLGFEDDLVDFEQKKRLGFEQKSRLGFEQKTRLGFEYGSVIEFGMSYTGTLATDETTIHASLADLPPYAPIRPDTRYFIYLDLDTDDATGGYPAAFPNPSEPGFNFPGTSDFVNEPPIGEEQGVDLILQVTLTSECTTPECVNSSVLDVFEFTGSGYTLTLTENDPDLSAYSLSLYIENGGAEPEVADVPTGFTIRPTLPNQLLFDNGWGFTAGPNGPVPNPVGVEVLVEIDCDGTVINDDASSAVVDCQCLDCNDCPDYPGCDGTTGTPRTLADTRITADQEAGELTFEPPVLPEAVVAPTLAAEGQTVTVYVYDLPTDVTGDVEVTLDGVQLATVPTSSIAADGSVSISVPLPVGKLGERRLSTGIVGFAPRAITTVTITPFVDEPDNDGDGVPDADDLDDDNDGVSDADELTAGTDPLNPAECGDADGDSCDDCRGGGDGFGPLPDADPANDGPDFDLDGLCDAGDPDDDNDGVADAIDGEPFNPDACGDTDGDLCDDCLVVSDTPSPLNDGPDFDGDGICDFSDPNQSPVAICADVPVNADAQCQASASVDNGSYDPEGLVTSIDESPAGPYGLGDTLVTLTIEDNVGDSGECTGTVTVVDATPPTITTCAEDRTLIASELDGTATLDDLTGDVAAGDNCGPLTVTQSPAAGSALVAGTTTVTLTVTDGALNTIQCTADVLVLDRLLSTEEKVKVHFDRRQDGTLLDDDDDDDSSDDESGAAVVDTPHCFSKLDLDGSLRLRDATLLPADVRTPGSTSVAARLVVSLSGEVIAEETLTLDVESVDDERWEFVRPGPLANEGVKRLKLDWTETASYDSHLGSGLGADVPQIKARFIGYDTTDTKLRFKNVARPFQVRFDDPLGGTVLITVLDANGTATVTPAGAYDLNDRKNALTLTLPFRLTPDTTLTYITDAGATEIDIPVDPELNFQPAGAKYKLDLDETAVSFALCADPTTPVNSLSTPRLDLQLFVGGGQSEVVGTVLVGPAPGDWTRIDDRQWKLMP